VSEEKWPRTHVHVYNKLAVPGVTYAVLIDLKSYQTVNLVVYSETVWIISRWQFNLYVH
jgi:hypothetical protein